MLLDTIESCLGDVFIITAIACYAYIGVILVGFVARRLRRS